LGNVKTRCWKSSSRSKIQTNERSKTWI